MQLWWCWKCLRFFYKRRCVGREISSTRGMHCGPYWARDKRSARAAWVPHQLQASCKEKSYPEEGKHRQGSTPHSVDYFPLKFAYLEIVGSLGAPQLAEEGLKTEIIPVTLTSWLTSLALCCLDCYVLGCILFTALFPLLSKPWEIALDLFSEKMKEQA